MTKESTDRILGRIEGKLDAVSGRLDNLSNDTKSKVEKHDDEIVKLKVWQGRYAGGAVVLATLVGFVIDKWF